MQANPSVVAANIAGLWFKSQYGAELRTTSLIDKTKILSKNILFSLEVQFFYQLKQRNWDRPDLIQRRPTTLTTPTTLNTGS